MKVLTILITYINILLCNSFHFVLRNNDFTSYKVQAVGLPACLISKSNNKTVVENVTAEMSIPICQPAKKTDTCGKNITVAIGHVPISFILSGDRIKVKYVYENSGKFFTRKLPNDCMIKEWRNNEKIYYCRFKDMNPNK